ncbi:MAG: ATP-binding protein [Candidatus Aegiribacteria sp.]|nr:ATP-binding protein [Candidatus Aegiribacteria sp.]
MIVVDVRFFQPFRGDEMEGNYTLYKAFHLPDRDPFSSYSCENEEELSSFSQINLFIGPNNSGKSRFLRALFSEKPLPFSTTDYDAHTFTLIANEARSELSECFGPSVVSIGEIDRAFLDSVVINLPKYIDPESPIYDRIDEKLAIMSQVTSEQTLRTNTTMGSNATLAKNLSTMISQIGKQYVEKFSDLDFERLGDEAKFYIPILRGLRALPIEEEGIMVKGPSKLYWNATVRDYFTKNRKQSMLDGFTGGQRLSTGMELYAMLKHMLLGDPDKRERVRKYEQFLSDNFFENRVIALIPREDDDIIHIRIGDEKQLPIHDLGDGLQTLIICTFNAFMETDRCLFFIEEPDTYMHPGMQRALIRALQFCPKHQFFLTTHSNHFLDMTMDFTDISIFQFRKTERGQSPKFAIKEVSSPDANILRDLGVLNSSVFLTNATVWVEGITDRMYIRAFLHKYLVELRVTNKEVFERFSLVFEDTHYSFVEYQGSTLEHWTFDPDNENIHRIKANYLCGNAILIADGDITSKRSGEREKFYRDCLGEQFIVLPCKEIENTIPEEVVRAVIRSKFEEHGGDISDVKYGEYSRLKTDGLGRFLDKRLKLKDSERVFSEVSGTIRNKQIFCNQAVRLMESPDFEWNLPKLLREFCEKIFTYIAEMNEM